MLVKLEKICISFLLPEISGTVSISINLFLLLLDSKHISRFDVDWKILEAKVHIS